MRYLKYLLILSLVSILFSESEGFTDEPLAKVYFKDGSDKIGYIDEDYSESQIKLASLDGGWALYSKKSINNIEYSGFDVKTVSKDLNSATMISFGSASWDLNNKTYSAQSFKYAFYTKKTENIFTGFSLSGWSRDFTTNLDGYVVSYLFGYSHLKFLNNSHNGFYYSIDGGMSYIAGVFEGNSLFGISPQGILIITQDPGYTSSGLEASRSAFGIGTNITTGYAFSKIMIAFSLGHSILPTNNNDFDITDGDHRDTRYYYSLNLSHLF